MTSSSPTSSATSTARTDLYPLCGVLKAVDDQSYGFEIPHRVEQFIVGRDLECDQPLLGEGSLSRFHCAINSVISPDNKAFLVYVTDISKNGCFINDVKLKPQRRFLIKHGSKLSFGGPLEDALSFMFTAYSPESLNARYMLVGKELGSGTFGTVVEALNRSTGLPVAVKIIPLGGQSDSPEDERRRRAVIQREMNLMSRITHPNIVRLEDAIVEDNNVYLVMELARYGNLSSLIHQAKHIAESDARIIAQQLCSALLCLHNANIIHRDIKPANILISSFVPPVIKITDFGLAKAHDDRAANHSVCGTPAYMAPEVCAANTGHVRYDFKVDSWSVGITILHMLSGEIPFPQGAVQLENGIDNREVRWEQLPATWSEEARDLIVRLCQRDPNQRISIADAVKHIWIAQASVGQNSASLS